MAADTDNMLARHALPWIGSLTGLALLAWSAGCTPADAPFARLKARACLERGQSHLEAENLDAALEEFQHAVELNPKLALAHSRIGCIFRRQGNYEAAVDAYAKAVTLNPFSFDDAFGLAQMYHRLARFANAVRAYLHACELEPDNFEPRLNLGVCYHQAEELESAIDCYTQAINLNPDQAAAYSNLGAAYDARGTYYEAIHAYNESLERDPNQPMVVVNLATTLIKQERFCGARKALERAIGADPELAIAYERLGYCYFRMRSYDEALTYYAWAATLDPKMPGPQAGLGVVHMATYLQEPTQLDLRRTAIEYWHRSLELEPDQPRIRNLIAKYGLPLDDPTAILMDAP